MTIYFVGHIAYDTIIYVKHFPKSNSAAPSHAVFNVFGGGATNGAVAASMLGAKAELVSLAGSDFASGGYKQYLSKKKVGLSRVKVLEDVLTSHAFMPVDKDKNQISYFFWGASAKFDALPIPKLKLKNGDIVHIAAGSPKFNKRFVSMHSRGVISFDPAYDVVLYSAKDLEFMLKRIKFLFVNEHELKTILAKARKRSAADLLSFGPSVVVVSEGKHGSTIYTVNGQVHVNAYTNVKAVDPTGAGDSYRAAFLTAYSKGMGLEECGKMGSAVASHVIEELGPQTGLPTWGEALKRARKL